MEVTLRFEVREASQVGEARRAAASRARALGFDETDAERVALVVTELGTNLVKHAVGGEILVAVHRASPSMHVVSIDRGPGTDSGGEWLADGYSTKGTRGTGLGAVSRLADGFDFHSTPERGTVVVARIEPSTTRGRRAGAGGRGAAAPIAEPVARSRFEIGGLAVPLDGEEECGDAWGAVATGPTARVLLSDGLGHGADAAAASAEAVRVFRAERPEGGSHGPAAALVAMSAALRSTRGAAASIAEIDPAEGCVRFAGLGNVAGFIVGADSQQSLLSRAGIVGESREPARQYTYKWTVDSLLVLHSDGLRSRWRLDEYPGLVRRDVTLIAAVLYRDFGRGTDDTAVVVARQVAERGDGGSLG